MKKITKNGNPIRWRYRSLKNWFYDKWMRWRGYIPYNFEPYSNRYTYIKRSEIDEFVKEAEEAPEFEEVHYDTVPPQKNPFYPHTDWDNLRRKHAKLKELRRNA
jgi:hypothetical protein